MSEGEINLGVYKEETSAFEIGRDNLVLSSNEDPEPPVSVMKRKYSETFNRVEVTWTNRDADYDTSVVIANDEVDQRISSQVRTKTINLQGATNAELAQMMVYRYLSECMYRFSNYSFTISYKDMLLEVGDVGTLNDGGAITNEKIRITNVGEDKDGKGLAIQAVEDKQYLYNIVKGSYSSQDTEHVETPSVIASDLVSPKVNFLHNRLSNEINLSFAPMASEVNGWQWHISFDDVSYDFIESVNSGELVDEWNVVGIVLNNLPEYPSIVHAQSDIIEVSLGDSAGEPNTTITDAEFFNEKRLCKVGEEIISFRDAVDISTSSRPNRWKLKNIMRGMLGTKAVAHSPSDSFVTLRTNAVYAFDQVDIGRKYWVKVATFYGTSVQDIDDVARYSDVIKGFISRPAPASMLRLTEDILDRTMEEYTGDELTVYWNNCAKLTGFNRGGYDIHSDISTFEYGDDESLLKSGNGVLFGSYSADTQLQGVNVKFETEAGALIKSSDVGIVETLTVSKSADLGNSDVVVLTVTPRRSLNTLRTNSITITGD